MGITALSIAAFVSPVVAAPSAPTPPPNPTDAQLSAAQKAKNDTAATVGKLSALITQAQSQLQRLTADAELAGQKYALAVSQLQQAQAAAVKAKQDVAAAETQVQQARANLISFAQQRYKSATVDLGPASLLTARDPSALLQTGDYTRYVADRHLDAKSTLDRATVEKSNADARARAAVDLQAKRTDEANRAKDAAFRAVQNMKSQESALQAQKAGWEKELAAAQDKLATLNGQRATYRAWKAEQERIARERARQAALARARAEAAARARAAELERQRQLQLQQQQNNNGGGGAPAPLPGPTGGGGNCHQSSPGDRAVCFALAWLGMPYAWAGGNANGPTYGVDSPGTDGWNDHTVYGFDCSGLTLYAWAQASGLYMDHYAASQFSQAGSFHPSPGQFQPGDLLFWSGDGTVGGIHHVALYIGNGNVIQAPFSGSYVQITPWDQVSPDYFGATRPLS